MAQEIEQFLMAKFQKGLDGKENTNIKIPLFNHFQEISTLLQKIFVSPPSPADSSSIREKLYYLLDLLAECQMLSSKHGFHSPKELLHINNIRSKLNKIKGELSSKLPQIGRVGPEPDNDAAASSSQDTQIPRSSVDESKVHGFDEEWASLKRVLLRRGHSGDDQQQFKAIAIVGVEGLGKTTLCQMIFGKPEVKSHFLPRIWVCMSGLTSDEDYRKDPKTALVKRMLVCLGVEKEIIELVLKTRGLSGLLCALYQQLVGKRYLVVLDDARETDKWYGELNKCCLTQKAKWDECLAYGLPKGWGGTVIVTSRNEQVAKDMVGEENLVPLLPLSDPDSCWKIFKDSVEKDGLHFSPLNEKDLKAEIKRKCGGIPLGAKIMGETMYKQLREAYPSK